MDLADPSFLFFLFSFASDEYLLISDASLIKPQIIRIIMIPMGKALTNSVGLRPISVTKVIALVNGHIGKRRSVKDLLFK